jgi:hypothetical protein
MASLFLRKVQHPQAPNNYRMILKTEHDGEFEIGSIGVQTFTSRDTAWTWGIDTVLPMRVHQSEGRGKDRIDCMDKFRAAENEPKTYQPANPAPDARTAPTSSSAGVGSESGGHPENQKK